MQPRQVRSRQFIEISQPFKRRAAIPDAPDICAGTASTLVEVYSHRETRAVARPKFFLHLPDALELSGVNGRNRSQKWDALTLVEIRLHEAS